HDRDDRDDPGEQEGVLHVGLGEQRRDGAPPRLRDRPHDAAERDQQQGAEIDHAQRDQPTLDQAAAAFALTVRDRRAHLGAGGDGAHTSSFSGRVWISRVVISTTTNEIPNSTVATAAAWSNWNWLTSWKM